ncbi:CKLF-like MARVEL transmembrane domain-containing protein 1 isoform X9 [Gorilla gorilla gorilla]|uniref:CKLF-like MARVEL transmembrane domain-containing protein 1 isoform X9 n=1 Tax=Gorilla gorilla gorilla TaxID=9595 RepID=UPI0008F55612|nr:CKLF-like MARVEL transmembrane domain-containing protein 1 isoform X9 [Gorilla gorilla gorilla]
MDPEHAKPESSEAPSGNLKQPETAAALASSGSVVSSVPKAQRNISAKTAPRKHTAVSIRSAQSAAAARPQGSEGTAPSRKATTRPPPKPTLPPPTPSAHTESKLLNETVIKERVEGRAKVPYKFTDSLKRFSFSPTGMLKILRLFFITGSYQQYHYSCVPFSSCHLGHARKEKKAFTLCRGAVIVCCIDAFVVTKKMTNLKRFLGVEVERKLSPAKNAYPETGPDARQRPA